MRLGIKMLGDSAQLNRLIRKDALEVVQGETSNMYFQLVDLDQEGAPRYIPTSSATVLVEVPRFPDIVPAQNNTRLVTDYTISRAAAMAFPSDDRSVWYMPLTAADTSNLISTSVKVTLTEGSSVKIGLASMGIRVTRPEGA